MPMWISPDAICNTYQQLLAKHISFINKNIGEQFMGISELHDDLEYCRFEKIRKYYSSLSFLLHDS